MKKETMVKKKKKSKRKKCCKKVYKRNFAFGNNRKRRKVRKSSPRNILGKRKIKRKGNGYWKWLQVIVLQIFLRKIYEFPCWNLKCQLKLFVINCMSVLIPVYVHVSKYWTNKFIPISTFIAFKLLDLLSQ